MNTWIALLRGINVGGHNVLPMVELRRDLEALGFEGVRTYIQSGNAVFDAPGKTASGLARSIARRIEERHGFRPHVLVITPEDLRHAVESNPFPAAETDPRVLHFLFLAAPPSDPNVAAIEAVAAPSEQYRLAERVFYLWAPDGLARSKLAAKVEKSLGVAATGRNFRTVSRLLDMVTGR